MLRAAFEGVEAVQYWKRTVEDRIRKFEEDKAAGGRKGKQGDFQGGGGGFQGGGLPGGGLPGGVRINPQSPPGTGKKALKRAAAAAAANAAGGPLKFAR